MIMSGLNSVSAVVWPWRDTGEQDVAAEKRRRDRRSLVQVAIMAAVALIMLFGFRYYIMAGVVSCLASVVLLSSRFLPTLYMATERLTILIASVVGVSMTWLLLVPFFYLCFVPGRLLLLMRGKDPLQRAFDKNKKSYWIAHPAPRPDHFTKQY